MCTPSMMVCLGCDIIPCILYVYSLLPAPSQRHYDRADEDSERVKHSTAVSVVHIDLFICVVIRHVQSNPNKRPSCTASNSFTMGPAYKKFGYSEHPAITSIFLCINIIDCNVKKFAYKFLLHLFTRCRRDPVYINSHGIFSMAQFNTSPGLLRERRCPLNRRRTVHSLLIVLNLNCSCR